MDAADPTTAKTRHRVAGAGSTRLSGAGVALDGPTATYTIDDALNRCGTWDRFHWFMLLYCGVSWICDAMEVMILSYLGPSARCEWNLSAVEESGLNSVVFAGMCVGSPVWGLISDTYGRKVSFFLATLISAVFGFATAAAPNFHALMAFRALVGFGIPSAVVSFNWLLELTPIKQRGLFAVAIEGFWTIGTVVQAGLAYALLNSKGWRILLLVSTIPNVILLLLLPLVPESPRFLLVKGRTAAAQQVLGKVLRVCGRELPAGVLRPLIHDSDVERPVTPTSSRNAGCSGVLGKVCRGLMVIWTALRQLFSAKLWSVTVVMTMMWVLAAFVYYGLVQLVPQLEFVAGESKQCLNGHLTTPTGDLIANVITSAAEVPGLIFTLLMVHYVSRKLAFSVPMGLIPAPLIPLMFGVKGPGLVACMFLARFFIYSAFNALLALCAEMYPTIVRNFGLGLNNSFSRIGGLLSPFAVVQARQVAWQYSPEAIFAACSLVAAALVLLLPHDKKGRALDDTLDDVKEVPPVQRSMSSVISRLSRSSAAGKDHHRPGSIKAVSGSAVGSPRQCLTDAKVVSAPGDGLLGPRSAST